MGNENKLYSIPCIDVSGFYGGDEDKISAISNEIYRAAHEVGFFYIVGHQTTDVMFSNIKKMSKSLFSLTQEEKMSMYIGNSKNHRGYIPEGEEVFYGGSIDHKEAFNLSPDELYRNINKNYPLIGDSQWPQIPGFKEIFVEYYNKTYELGKLILSSLEKPLGLDSGFFRRILNCPPSVLRLLYYPPSRHGGDRPGIGSHTDYEFLTILYSDSPGLEVMNGDGSWIEIPPIDNAYVVNIGDMLEFMTAGYFVAASHRVQKIDRARYSFPFFLTVDYDTEIIPLQKYLTKDNMNLSKRKLVAGEHLYNQLISTYKYLQSALAMGAIKRPGNVIEKNSFGYEARVFNRAHISNGC